MHGSTDIFQFYQIQVLMMDTSHEWCFVKYYLDNEGPPMKLYVDLKSRRIVKDSGIFAMDSEETELSSEFHDFRKVDGQLLPFRVVNYGGGQRIGEVRIN